MTTTEPTGGATGRDRALELPADHPRPPIKTYSGALQTLSLPASLCKDLRAMSQREHVTLFMLLLAAFQVLLSRYSGQQDIAVGTPIANRTHREVEGLIGFFVNTLVLRSQVQGTQSFRQFLEQVREMALEAYAHQDVPFEQLVEMLQPERDLSRSPSSRSCLVFRKYHHYLRLRLSACCGSAGPSSFCRTSTTKFDLSLLVNSGPAGFSCGVEYNTDLFEASTIERLLRHWQRLLEGIAIRPEAPLADLPLLTTEEQHLLLIQWNATMRPLSGEVCFHHLVEEQAQLHADVVALMQNDHHLTYKALNDLSNCLALALQSRDVGPDVLVGLCLPRSLELVIGLLAILKAGGAYVPLDPGLPAERLHLLQQEARFSLLLTTRGVMQKRVADRLSMCS